MEEASQWRQQNKTLTHLRQISSWDDEVATISELALAASNWSPRLHAPHSQTPAVNQRALLPSDLDVTFKTLPRYKGPIQETPNLYLRVNAPSSINQLNSA